MKTCLEIWTVQVQERGIFRNEAWLCSSQSGKDNCSHNILHAFPWTLICRQPWILRLPRQFENIKIDWIPRMPRTHAPPEKYIYNVQLTLCSCCSTRLLQHYLSCIFICLPMYNTIIGVKQWIKRGSWERDILQVHACSLGAECRDISIEHHTEIWGRNLA